ncbi:MAG: NigD-like C-terminal domain-containing protein [Bacteroidaceae bacterium]|nr:NigD-like C-terminal domain-containing protein [Bacteroidaceae bacterium]
MGKNKIVLLFFVLFCGLITACSTEDDWTYPPVLTSFLSGQTDSEGTLSSIVLANQERFLVDNEEPITGLVKDTLYRLLGVYSVDRTLPQPTATIYSLQQTLSFVPLPIDQLVVPLKTDPVTVKSVSYSGGYLNIIVSMLMKAGGQVFHVVKRSSVNSLLDLVLFHDLNGDEEAYPRTVYLSIPLMQESLTAGDSIALQIQTYTDSIQKFQFVYK